MGLLNKNKKDVGKSVSNPPSAPKAAAPAAQSMSNPGSKKEGEAAAEAQRIMEEEKRKKAAAQKAASDKVAAEKAAADKAASEQEAAKRAAADKAASEAEAKKKAAEEAKRKAEAEAKAKAEAEAAKMDAATRKRHDEEEKKWRAELATLTAKKALDPALAERLSNEIVALRHKLLEGKDGAETLEKDIKENEKDANDARKMNSEEISSLNEQNSSVRSVLQIFSGFNDTCEALTTEVQVAHEAIAQHKQDAQSIASRIQQELKEAEERLGKAEVRKGGLEKQMESLLAEIEPAEKKAEEELQQLSNAAISARLQAQLGERHTAMVKAELAALMEALMEAEAEVKRHDAKVARVEETRKQVKELKAQLAADEDSMKMLAARERKLEAAEAEATRRARKMSDMYDAQLASAKQLTSIQKEFLDAQLAGAEVTPAGKPLFDKTAAFVKTQHEASLKEVSELEVAKTKHEAAAAEAVKGRHAELRQLVAESGASSPRDAQALEALKTKDKGRVSSLRVQIDSERSVALEQTKYVTLLQGRLKDDSLLTLSETDEDTKVRQRGLALVEANGSALQSRLGEMKAKLDEGEAARERAEQALREIESTAAAEDKTLNEQLSATRDAVAQLATYEAGLVKLLAEGGGEVVGIDVGPESTRGATVPAGDKGEPTVPSIISNLVSSAELATRVIDENVKAASASRMSRRSTIDAGKGVALATPK